MQDFLRRYERADTTRARGYNTGARIQHERADTTRARGARGLWIIALQVNRKYYNCSKYSLLTFSKDWSSLFDRNLYP